LVALNLLHTAAECSELLIFLVRSAAPDDYTQDYGQENWKVVPHVIPRQMGGFLVMVILSHGERMDDRHQIVSENGFKAFLQSLGTSASGP
jgi:hypothetical protein